MLNPLIAAVPNGQPVESKPPSVHSDKTGDTFESVLANDPASDRGGAEAAESDKLNAGPDAETKKPGASEQAEPEPIESVRADSEQAESEQAAPILVQTSNGDEIPDALHKPVTVALPPALIWAEGAGPERLDKGEGRAQNNQAASIAPQQGIALPDRVEFRVTGNSLTHKPGIAPPLPPARGENAGSRAISQISPQVIASTGAAPDIPALFGRTAQPATGPGLTSGAGLINLPQPGAAIDEQITATFGKAEQIHASDPAIQPREPARDLASVLAGKTSGILQTPLPQAAQSPLSSPLESKAGPPRHTPDADGAAIRESQAHLPRELDGQSPPERPVSTNDPALAAAMPKLSIRDDRASPAERRRVDIAGQARVLTTAAPVADLAPTSPVLPESASDAGKINWISETGILSGASPHSDQTITAKVPLDQMLRHPDLPRHIAAQIADVVQRGGADRPVELRLNPAELGRVRITMATVDGTINVSVVAERPETLDLMRRHIEVLAREFLDIGYGGAEFAFGQSDSGPGTDTNHDPDQNTPAATALTPEHAGEDPADPASIPVLSVNSDRVDIRL